MPDACPDLPYHNPDVCPKCWADSAVVDSRPHEAYRMRRRRCLNDACQHLWMTYEVTVKPHGHIRVIIRPRQTRW